MQHWVLSWTTRELHQALKISIHFADNFQDAEHAVSPAS